MQETTETKELIKIDTNAKKIYLNVLKSKLERPTSENSIANIYETELTQEDWENIYRIPYTATIESKLRSFHFKLTHNIYYTNIRLHRDGISETQNCSFCSLNVPESIEHLFIDCPKINPIWGTLNNMCNAINFEALTKFEKIFGVREKNLQNYNLINHMLLMIKYYIHICRIKIRQPSSNGLKAKIIEIESMERNIAIKKHKSVSHTSKWDQIIS